VSTLNVDKVDPSTGTTLELGTSGDTVSIPSGVTLSNSGTFNASGITAGTVATARLGSGTASSSVFLRGDSSWAAPGGGIDCDADSWQYSLGASTDQNVQGVIDFDTQQKLGSNVTESAGTITVSTAGWYFIQWSLSNYSTVTDTTVTWCRKNGTKVGNRLYWTSISSYDGKTFGQIVEASASDTFDIYGEGYWHGAADPESMSFWVGYRLGA
jgi:hypothetical protein